MNFVSFIKYYISPTVVNDTSMERSSRLLQHGNPNNQKLIYFSKNVEIEF